MHDIQEDTLVKKYLEIESAYTQAMVYCGRSGRGNAYITEDESIVNTWRFGKAVCTAMLMGLTDLTKTKTGKELADKADGMHCEICNIVSSAFMFTDAESVSCPCNDYDIHTSVLESFTEVSGSECRALSDSLRPIVRTLYAIAVIENDDKAATVAKRILDRL
jgi:hypothetical protein